MAGVEFENEDELSQWVSAHHDRFFERSTLWIQRAIPLYPTNSTKGAHRKPDAIFIDFRTRQWGIVEIELSTHGLWRRQRQGIIEPGHIADQLTVFAAALRNPLTLALIQRAVCSDIEQNDNYSFVSSLIHESVACGIRSIQEITSATVADIILAYDPIIAVFIDDLGPKSEFLNNVGRLLDGLKCHIQLYRVRKDSNGAITSPDDFVPFRSFGNDPPEVFESHPHWYFAGTNATVGDDVKPVLSGGELFWVNEPYSIMHCLHSQPRHRCPYKTFYIADTLFDIVRVQCRSERTDDEPLREEVVLVLEEGRWVNFEFRQLQRMLIDVNAVFQEKRFQFHVSDCDSTFRLFGQKWSNGIDISDHVG